MTQWAERIADHGSVGRALDVVGWSFGQPLRGLHSDPAAVGRSVAGDLHQLRDQVVALGQFAPASAVGRQIRLAQLLAQLSQGVDSIRVGADQLVGQPRRDRGLAQSHDRRGRLLVAAVAHLLREPIARSDELLGRQPVQPPRSGDLGPL